MENELIIQKDICSSCKESITENVIFCANCGHPENGTEKQKAQYFAKKAMQKNNNIDAKTKINSATNTLFVLCGLMILFGLFSYFGSNDIIELGINFFVGFIYLGLAFWSKNKPFIALLSGLLLYLTLVLISAIIDPISLVRGIIWKIIIISYLGKGLYSAFNSQKINS